MKEGRNSSLINSQDRKDLDIGVAISNDILNGGNWEKRKNIRRQRAPLGDQSGQTASFTQCTSGRVQMEPAWEGRHLGACRILNTGTHVSWDNRKVMVPWEDRTQICFREDRSSCAGQGGKGQQPEEPDQWGWSPVVKYRSISTPKKIMMLLDYNMLTREARIL